MYVVLEETRGRLIGVASGLTLAAEMVEEHSGSKLATNEIGGHPLNSVYAVKHLTKYGEGRWDLQTEAGHRYEVYRCSHNRIHETARGDGNGS